MTLSWNVPSRRAPERVQPGPQRAVIGVISGLSPRVSGAPISGSYSVHSTRWRWVTSRRDRDACL